MAQTPVSNQLRMLAPYFAGTQWAFAVGMVGAALAALCESGVTWLMAVLVDGNFKALPIARLAELPHPPLWAVPVILIVLFAVRGVAGFVVDYALSWAAQSATLRLRERLFTRILDATPDGRAVYRRLGFQDSWGFQRFIRREPRRPAAATSPPAGTRVRALASDDWPASMSRLLRSMRRPSSTACSSRRSGFACG